MSPIELSIYRPEGKIESHSLFIKKDDEEAKYTIPVGGYALVVQGSKWEWDDPDDTDQWIIELLDGQELTSKDPSILRRVDVRRDQPEGLFYIEKGVKVHVLYSLPPTEESE